MGKLIIMRIMDITSDPNWDHNGSIAKSAQSLATKPIGSYIIRRGDPNSKYIIDIVDNESRLRSFNISIYSDLIGMIIDKDHHVTSTDIPSLIGIYLSGTHSFMVVARIYTKYVIPTEIWRNSRIVDEICRIEDIGIVNGYTYVDAMALAQHKIKKMQEDNPSNRYILDHIDLINNNSFMNELSLINLKHENDQYELSHLTLENLLMSAIIEK